MNVRFFELRQSAEGVRLSPPWDFDYNPNSGLITCRHVHDEPNQVWCEHMGPCVQAGADADAIWEPTGTVGTPDGEGVPVFEDQMRLDIPMFPTVGLWASVTLTLIPRPTMPMYSVEWDHPNGRDGLLIGHITRGEGRKVIRELMVEFMWAAPDREVECQAAHHGLAAQIEWSKCINDERRTREAWSVYIHDWCTYCRVNRGDNSDLIPAAENTGVWS